MEEKDVRMDKIDEKRRSFIKKLVVGSAFAVPVLKSFSLDQVKAKSLYAPKVDAGRGTGSRSVYAPRATY